MRTDPRHRRREEAITELFSIPFHTHTMDGIVSRKVQRHIANIDLVISKAAPEWSIKKINRIDLTILRLAVWELLFNASTPPKVAINEAVELAKKYGAEATPGFVNGVLGTILKTLKKGKETNS